SVWHTSKSDPIAALLLDLESSENNLPSCGPSCYCAVEDISARASTSSAQEASSQFFDARIRYGHRIMAVMQKISIGSRLSAVLIGKDGLDITLSSYEELNGEQIWQNTPLLSVLGKQLALPPRNVKKMAYYKNMTAQFFQLIKWWEVPTRKVVAVVLRFCD
ncbi:hypothetical protein OSTOST_25195, partial [Ostertagia ostertagi]